MRDSVDPDAEPCAEKGGKRREQLALRHYHEPSMRYNGNDFGRICVGHGFGACNRNGK
jgi:hypothetical protein